MGLQFRKRTKGKNGWLNISHSKKNGLSASLSVKLDKNLTLNFGGKGNRRATVNFGNGVRYVKYRTPKAKEKKVSEPRSRSRRSNTTYTPVYQPNPVTEMLRMCQGAIIEQVPNCGLTHHGDLQVMVDLYNAIDFMIEDPNSIENRDLMLVTTNQFVEVAQSRGSENLIKISNAIRSYIKGVLPKKEIPLPEVKEVREPINKTLLWGTAITICCLIAFCSS